MKSNSQWLIYLPLIVFISVKGSEMAELGNAIQFTLLPVQTAPFWSLCFIQIEFKKLQKLWLHYCLVLCSLLKESFEKWHLVTRDLQGFGEELQSCLIDFCVVTDSWKDDQWGKKNSTEDHQPSAEIGKCFNIRPYCHP